MSFQIAINRFEAKFGERLNLSLTMLSLAYLWVYSTQVLARPAGLAAGLLNFAANSIYVIFGLDCLWKIVVYASQEKSKRNLRQFIFTMALPVLALLAPAFRTLRLFRVLLTLRGFVGLVKNRAESAGLMVLLSFPIIAYTSALAILDVERNAAGSNITSLKDALWWALITMTTVGYGDHYPVTDEGKLIASGLLITGIVIFSTITAIVSSWILTERKTQ